MYRFVSFGVLDTHACAPLVDFVRKLTSDGDWCVEVNLVYHEANVRVDKLAKYEHSLKLGVMFFDRLPSFVS